MKITICAATALAAAAMLAGSVSPSFGQAPPAGQPQYNPSAPPAGGQANPGFAPAPAQGDGRLGLNGIAIVDVPYIFKNHARFKQQIQMMEGKVREADTSVKKDQEALKAKAEEVKAYQPGSAEFKRGEAEFLKLQGDLNLKVSLQKKDLLEQEGKIYFGVSMEIDDAVKQLASKNGINLVLRFNGDPVDPNDRNEILRGINKPIVYYDQRMDITPYILRDLNRTAAPAVSNPNAMPVPTRR